MPNSDPGRLRNALARYRAAIEVSLTDEDEAALEAAAGAPPRVHELDLGGDVVGDLAARMVDRLLLEALDMGASDLHLLPLADAVQVYPRVDGALRPAKRLSGALADGLTSRLRSLAGLPPAERGRPRRGAFELRLLHDGPPLRVGVRVSVCPSRWGEHIALRLLPDSVLRRDLGALGMDMSALGVIRGSLKRKYGLVLISGPPGSGRTTTLHAAANELARPERAVAMVSETVEYSLPGVVQVQAGKEMSGALRAVLRTDPDVVFVDAMRDQATAEAALRASLEGRLVIACFGGMSVGSALGNLLSLGVAPRLVVPAVKVVSCQKLVRGICPDCVEPAQLSEQSILDLGIVPEQLDSLAPKRGGGCAACAGTGYRGRLGLFEAVEMSRKLGGLILDGAQPVDVKTAAARAAVTTMQVAALSRFEAGRTTVEIAGV